MFVLRNRKEGTSFKKEIMYIKGDNVSIIDRNNASGIISIIEKHGPITYYGIMLDTEQFVTTTENNMKPHIQNPSAIDLLGQANFQSKEIYLVSSVINKMFGNSNDIIATLKSSKTTFLPYQFKPLNKFLKSDNRRILIADEVGLGKTIEAGYILAELSLRGQIKNCLIICKSSLKIKWQNELKEKFGFDFKILDRKELINAISEDIKNGSESVFAIINYDYSEKGSQELLNIIESKEYTFDILIVDEAHILRNENTIKHDAVKRLIKVAKNSVFLTATPVMTSLRNLYSLVKIIEPRYDNYKDDKTKQDFGYSLFTDHLSLSRPFIDSLNSLNKGIKPKEIIADLLQKQVTLRFSSLDGKNYSNASIVTVSDRFKDDPLFQSVIKMAEKEDFTYADIALFQKRLSELNSFQDIITRTRKREVQTEIQTVTRHAEKITVKFSVAEMELYDSIINDYEGEPLVLVQRKRQATSCLPAYIEKYHLSNENSENILENDSKFNEFKKIIDEIVLKRNKKLIVFSFFKGTLRYLERRLISFGIGILKIDGDIPIDNRQGVIKKFETDTNKNILLSSEVGSEGLDMQFCDALINYDLPWNPMVVEQRIGRIDRIGQKSNIIYIYNLCIANTIEEQIFERLLNRIRIFNETIGSLEDILSSEVNIFEVNEGLETEIYGHKLNKEALERKLKDVEIALENAELIRKDIEINLDESFLNEGYIIDEISTINKQKRFITSEDIKALILLLFQERLATLRCDLNATTPYLRWNEGQNNGLFDFIQQNIPTRKENSQLFLNFIEFKRKYIGKNKIDCTFNQEEAYENKMLEFISPTHPVAQAAFNFFKSQNTLKNNAFFFCIDKNNLPIELPNNEIYVLAKYNMETLKFTMAKPEADKSAFELQLLFSLNEDGEFTLMSEDETILLLNVDIKYWYVNNNNAPTMDECSELVTMLKPVLMHEFFNKKAQIEHGLREVHQSRQYRLIDTERDFLKRQIENFSETLIDDPENKIRFIYQKRIEQYAFKIKELEEQKIKIRLELNEALQSLSLIQIQ